MAHIESAASPNAPAPAIPAADEGTQHRALQPPQPEVPSDPPVLHPCEVRMLELADGLDGAPEMREVLWAEESGLTCLLLRRMEKAIYGEVWQGLEVTIHAEGYFTARRNENGSDRYLAVKKMKWEVIDLYRGHVTEDPIREISTLSRLSNPGHAHVLRRVEALDDEPGGILYLLTPFIDGGDLFNAVSREEGFSEEVAKLLFRQIVEGMLYMHSEGICHADMSLENVLVDRDLRNAYIIDFGMSLVMPTNNEGLRMMSVPDGRSAKRSYCPPEIFKNKPYDGVKVDVFTAGAMLFMMLTGQPPYEAATRADPDFKQLVWRGDVQGLLECWGAPPLPDAAADLVRQMMAYRAEDRPLPAQVLEHAWLASGA